MKKIFLALAFVASTSGGLFAAVKDNKFGVNYMYNAGQNNIGAQWHITSVFAIRPSIGFSTGTTTTTTTTTGNVNEVTGTTLEFGIAVPIYLANFNLLDLYVAPSFGYTSTSGKTTNTIPVSSADSKSSGINAGAALGLQIALNDQLHVFGELGLGYSSTDNPNASATTTRTSNQFGLSRTAIGAIFYFN